MNAQPDVRPEPWPGFPGRCGHTAPCAAAACQQTLTGAVRRDPARSGSGLEPVFCRLLASGALLLLPGRSFTPVKEGAQFTAVVPHLHVEGSEKHTFLELTPGHLIQRV